MSFNYKKLFIIDLTYIAPLDDIDKSIPAHIEYLDAGYAAGMFVASGRKDPRVGGVIIATGERLEDVSARVDQDPFVIRKLAKVTITEFHPSKTKDDFQLKS